MNRSGQLVMDKLLDFNDVKEAVALRAQELGSPVGAKDVALHFLDLEVAPGCRIFRADWGCGKTYGALSGLIMDNDQLDTYPIRSLSKIFGRWLETDEELLNANLIAKVSAFMLDPNERHKVIFSDKDLENNVVNREWLEHIRGPKLTMVKGNQGIEFWWVGYQGISLVKAYLDESRSIKFEEIFIQKILESKEFSRNNQDNVHKPNK